MIVKCNNCKNDFKRQPAKIKEDNFCSIKCWREWSVGSRATNYRGGELKLICPICNKQFNARKSKRDKIRYCSVKCKHIGTMKRIPITCENCHCVKERTSSYIKWHTKRNHKHHFCSKKCMQLYFSGPNAPGWIKDRSKLKCESRSIRWSKRMRRVKKSVYRRDNWTCQECGKGNRMLNAHHIERFVDNVEKRFDKKNLITLCVPCHKKTYRREKDFEEKYRNIVLSKYK